MDKNKSKQSKIVFQLKKKKKNKKTKKNVIWKIKMFIFYD